MDLKGIIYAVKVIPNPDYPGLVTYQLINGRIFACKPDGSSSDSDAGAHGPLETAQQTGNVAVFQPTANVFYSFAVLMVDKIWP